MKNRNLAPGPASAPRAVVARHPVQRLMGTEAMATCPLTPPAERAVVYHPTAAGLRALAAANLVVAQDVTDPTRQQAVGTPRPDPLPGNVPVVLVVELDIDTDELPWLVAAVKLAADLRAAGKLPPATSTPTD